MARLLDSNICIALINRKSGAVGERLRRLNPDEIKVSAITVAELRYGADKSQAPARNHRALDGFLAPFGIIDFDERCALAYGKIRSNLARAGTPIGPLDTLIAAQAMAYGLILVTNNLKEFQRIADLTLEDWLD